MINLSSYPLSAEQVSILKLGLTFCPTQRVDQFELIKDINLFSRRLMFKILYDKPDASNNGRALDDPAWRDMTIADIKAMEELMELWEEGGLEEDDLLEADSLLLGADSPSPLPPSSIPTSLPRLLSKPREYKPKSRTFPTLQGNLNVWAFTNQVTREITQTKWKDVSRSNLTTSQLEALKLLLSNKDIVIKPSDKGATWSLWTKITMKPWYWP